jgi:DNA-binding IclR family transcriptional regulator
VINLLTRHRNGATFAEICEALDMPKSSAHALLRTMVEQSYLMLDPTSRRYQVGVRLWEAGQAYLGGLNLPVVSRPYMEQARDLLGETVQMAILDGIENVYVAKVEADQRLVLQSHVGSRLPAYATGLGKVLLSGLDDEEVRSRFAGVTFERFTDRTITDIEGLIERLHVVRKNGYGTDDGEYTAGVVCVAVPVRDHTGRVAAAMSVSVPDVRSSEDTSRHHLEVLTQQAQRLSQMLGYALEPA